MEWTSPQLRSLVELTRRGTVTAVARSLGYTPGGVSQQIAALERSTGMELLRRVGRRVELTDAGVTLAAHAERILATEAEAVEALERTRHEVSGTLRVGLFATAAAEILPLALRHAREACPGLTVRSRDMDVDDVYDAVAGGSVELALGLDYPDVPLPRDASLCVLPLSRERFSLAASAGELPGRETVALHELRELGWILPPAGSYYGRAALTACRRAGFEPRVLHEVTDTAATGVGVSLVTDLMLRLRPSYLDVLGLSDTVERQIVAVCRTAARHRPTVAALLGVLRSAACAPADAQGRRPAGQESGRPR